MPYETKHVTADMSLYFDCATMHSEPFDVGVVEPIKRRKNVYQRMTDMKLRKRDEREDEKTSVTDS